MSSRKDFLTQLNDAIDSYLSSPQSVNANFDIKLSSLAKLPSPPSSWPITPPTPKQIPADDHRRFFGNKTLTALVEYYANSPSSSTASYSPRSSPSVMPNTSNTSRPQQMRIEKSRTVKRNYQRKGQGFKWSSQQLREVERNEELKRRADKIKQKEERSKRNKTKKEEKERKAREERQRLGLPEPGFRLDEDQRSLTQLFGFGKKAAAVKEQDADSNTSDWDGEGCEEFERCPPATPCEPASVYGDQDVEGDSEMSDECDDSLQQLADPVSNEAGLNQATSFGPSTTNLLAVEAPTTADSLDMPSNVDLGLPADWEIYVDSDADIEKDLVEDKPGHKDTNNYTFACKGNPPKLVPVRKILKPKAPLAILNKTEEQLAEEVLAMISTQDLASDQENLDPTQPSPDEKSSNYNVPSSATTDNKPKRRHDDVFGDEEEVENGRFESKQRKRSPLGELPSAAVEPTTPLRELMGSMHDFGTPMSEPQTPSRAPQAPVPVQDPSSQDEYYLKSTEGLEAALIAEVDEVEEAAGLRAMASAISSHDWFQEFMMGTQELKEIGLSR